MANNRTNTLEIKPQASTSTSKTILHFIRHGEVENPKRVRYGRLPGFHLNAAGRKQAEEASLFFTRRPITHIYSSPLERTQQTATLIGIAAPYAPITLDIRLLETKTPALFEGKSRDRHFYLPHHTSDEAEDADALAARLLHFCEEKVIAHQNQEIIAITHGDPLAVLTTSLLFSKHSPEGAPYPAYASIFSFIFEGLTLKSVWYHPVTGAGGARS